MSCTCRTLSNLNLNCEPTIGGIQSVTFVGAGPIPEGGTEPADVTVQTLPESSTYNSVMTYDKSKNVRYWTTDVSLNIGELTTVARTFVTDLPCMNGRTIKLTLYSGTQITITEAFIQTATFNVGALKSDASEGILAFQAITKDSPTVVDRQ